MSDKNNLLTCDCSGCSVVEKKRGDSNLPYRYKAVGGQLLFSVLLLPMLQVIGAILIGKSTWAFVPILSLIAAYFVNSFLFCATCSYHHEKVWFCGCTLKSVFPYKRYKVWGHFDNLVGWPLLIGIIVVPTMIIFAYKNDWPGLMIYCFSLFAVIVLQSIFSCPNCRQRSLCYLGIFSLAFKKR